MKKLWQKNWQLDKKVEAFETKGDLLIDQKLVKYDCLGSIAHARMLSKIGILTNEEYLNLRQELLTIIKLEKLKKFILKEGDEDVHTKIENYLTKKLGDAAKKIHTGRSRNDQVLTALRLYTKEQLHSLMKEVLTLSNSFLSFAAKHQYIIMPGYTHMQKAMPSSIGLWSSSFAWGLLDSLELVKTAYLINDQCPLGSAAAYGVPLPLDRELTAKSMGFSRVQINSLYCQNSRGKIEAAILASLVSVLQDINRFGTDLLIFTTSEFNFFRVEDVLCSGSSIMPQKRNLDVAELLRSKVHLILGDYSQMVGLSSNLLSGYNRDLQDSKKALLESLEITLESVCVANILINNIYPNKKNLEAALTPEIFATHQALEAVKKGVAFREAYSAMKTEDYLYLGAFSDEIFKQSTHVGGIGNLQMGKLKERICLEQKELLKTCRQHKKRIHSLITTNLPVLEMKSMLD